MYTICMNMMRKIWNSFTTRFDDTQRMSIAFGVFFLVCGLALYGPIREIFAGNAKLEQQFGVPLPFFLEFLRSSIGSTIFIRYYSICILLGVLSGYMLTLYLAKKQYVAGTTIDRLLIGLLVFGLIGARALYVVFHLDEFRIDPISVLYVWLGGIAIYGALFTSIAYIWVYTRRFQFNFFEFMDFLAPGVLLGQIIGRFGNFFNYESYGPATSVYWKMFVPQTAKVVDSIYQNYFHPTFLYEIVPNSILFVGLLWVYGRLTKKNSGLIFALYCIGYGQIRFVTEFFRLDALSIALPFRIQFGFIDMNNIFVSQVLSALLFVIGWVVLWRRNKVIYVKHTMSEYDRKPLESGV
jgi:phosphatidylglycerol---prolipoprotein diacylglyceryl transferase